MVIVISIYFLIVSILVNGLFLKLTRRLFVKIDLVDQPGIRKIHQEKIPLSGGIGFLLTIAAVVFFHIAIFVYNKTWFFSWDIFGAHRELASLRPIYLKVVYLCGAGAMIWLSGLWDDIHKRFPVGQLKFPVLTKVGVQIIAATLIVFKADIHLTFFGIKFINIGLSMIWIIGITNTFNLLDNMGGLSAGIAAIAAVVLAVIAFLQQQVLVGLFLSCFVGSLIGFLVHNFSQKKKIFLGDSGALLVGFMLSTLTLAESYMTASSNNFFPILIPVIVLALPLCDTFYVIHYRLKNRLPIYVGDTNHISHKLVRVGFSRVQAVVLLYIVSFSLSMTGILLLFTTFWYSLIIIFQILVSLGLLYIIITHGQAKAEF